jgi:hypothetical protein
MANDDRRSEQFVREVDEELRRDQLKALWDRYAPLIIGVCLLVVAVTAGYRGWIWWQERQAAEAGDRFVAALDLIESGDRAAGEAELAAIAEEGARGYSPLARLRLAGSKVAAGETEQALADYDAIAADASTSPALRDVARLRAALLALDLGQLEAARERAEQLNDPANPWRHAAREVLGLVAYENNALEEAREIFANMQSDAETPPDLWVRSGMMLSLIESRIPAAGAADAAPADGGTEEETSGEAGPAETGSNVLPVPTDAAPVLPPTPGLETEADRVADPAAQTPIPPQ